MCHAFVKRITTLSAEKMAVMPILAQCNHMLANDGSLTMFTFWCKALVKIEMTVESLSLISVFSHGLALFFRQKLASSTAPDSVKSFFALCRWLRMYLERFQSSSTSEAYKTFWMKVFYCSA
jgi:hypothetical protein